LERGQSEKGTVVHRGQSCPGRASPGLLQGNEEKAGTYSYRVSEGDARGGAEGWEKKQKNRSWKGCGDEEVEGVNLLLGGQIRNWKRKKKLSKEGGSEQTASGKRKGSGQIFLQLLLREWFLGKLVDRRKGTTGNGERPASY